MSTLVLLLGFASCFGFIFLLIALSAVRMFFVAKNGGLALAPKVCPHCGAPTLTGGAAWYPRSPAAFFRASSIGVGPFQIGGPLTKAGWTCTQCGGTAT